jgi:hypothetical protein
MLGIRPHPPTIFALFIGPSEDEYTTKGIGIDNSIPPEALEILV